MFYPVACASTYREEPCRTALNRVKGMPFAWSLNPYTGCAHRCTFCYVRGVRGAGRPAVRRPLRPLDPRQGQRRRGAARASSRAAPGSGRRSRSAPPPTRTSPPRARYRLTRACIVELGRAPHAVLAHHARADGRGATSTSSPRRPSARRCTSASRCRRSTSGSGARPSPARRRRGDGSRPCASSPTPGSTRASRSRRSCPASPTTRSSSPRSSGRRARPARRGIWANVLYLRPGTREHFLEALARDWPELLAARTSGCTRGARYLPATETEPVRAPCARSPARAGAPRRPTLRPEPEPEQLDARLVGTVCGDRRIESRARRIDRRGGERRDHRPDRGRPRGRARGPAPGAAPLAAHPRRRRGARRRDGRRPRRAPPARRRHHGPADAADGRHRGDRGDRARASPTRACSSSPPTASGRCSSAGSSRAPRGYILKEAPHETLLKAIEKVAAGETFVDPALIPSLATGARRPGDPHRSASARSCSCSPTGCRTPTSRSGSSSRRRR